MKMKKILMTALLASVLSPLASASSVNLTSGGGFGLIGASYEATLTPSTALEVGVGSFFGNFDAVLGVKYFFQGDDQGPYLSGRAFVFPGSTSAVFGGTVTGGYRRAFNPLQFSFEAGGGIVGATGQGGSAVALPVLSVSVGYRF